MRLGQCPSIWTFFFWKASLTSFFELHNFSNIFSLILGMSITLIWQEVELENISPSHSPYL